MSQESASWDELPHELMEDWNPDADRGPLSLDSGDEEPTVRPTMPSRLRSWRPDDSDSIPAGSTALCRAFVLSPADRPDAGSQREAEDGDSGGEPSPDGAQRPRHPDARDPASGPGRRLPSVNEEVKGFKLVLELGRGAFARVFLAEEINLGHRLVALKVSRAEGEEPRILARLQHPNIVPVHSVHDDPDTGLRLLCMPFLGGANLAQLLQETWGLAPNQATGQSLMEALDHLSQRLPPAIGAEPSLGSARSRRARPRSLSALPEEIGPARQASEVEAVAPASRRPSVRRLGSYFSRLMVVARPPAASRGEIDRDLPSRRFLRGANAIEAAVWIVARLAEGLDHAHDRGLLHRDLKPANVLVAADGTPMLLDFNLAAETEPREDHGAGGERIARAMLGGTLPYMSPEHLDAFDPEGTTTPELVDERSDLYALGLILYEMIAGEHPFPEPPDGIPPIRMIRQMREERLRRPVPSLRARCPDVPWSLDALVSQCLDPDPERRYSGACELAEDLRRFLENRPMRHCPEPSLRERAAKWARRHPTACSSTSIVAASLVLLGGLLFGAKVVYDGMVDLAARMKLQALGREFTDTQFLLNTAGRREETLKRGILQARSILHQQGIPDPLSRPSAASGSAPEHLLSGTSRWIGRLTVEEQLQVKRDLIELMMLEARATVVLAETKGDADDRRRAALRAIARLDQAQAIDAPIPPVLFHERARYHERIGDHLEADRDRARAAGSLSRGSRDLTLLGTALLAAGDLAGAEAALRKANAQDPTSLWAWFVMGHCHFEQCRYADAAADFSAAVACGPRHAWTHFNRGLALARSGRPLDAKLAYDRAIELDPGLIEARVDRGLVELQLDRPDEALGDLRAAVDAGCHEVGVLAALGETLARLGRGDEAEAQFHSLLARAPGDPVVLIARGMTRLSADPETARSDFLAVLQSDPRNPVAHYGMARVIRDLDPIGALSHLDLALEEDPGQVDALQLRALVRARRGLRSALDDVDRLLLKPTTEHLYNAACALALFGGKASDPASLDRAVDLVALAIRAGFPAARAVADPDLSALKDRPTFRRLLARIGTGTDTAQPQPAEADPR